LAREFERRLEVKLEPRGLVEPSPREWAYRSRVRLKMGAEGVLGYHELESNRLVAIERCLVATTELDAAQKFLRETHLRATELEIVGKHAAQVLIVHCAAFNDGHLKRAARALEQDSRLAGLVLKSSSRRVVLGDAALAYEPEDGYEIVADADSFSQVNLAQNQKLVATVVDSDELAIAAARRNAQRMNLPNAQFIATPAASTAQFLHRAKYHPAVVLLDPPRTGAAALLEPLARLRAPQIIYVSCDPHTLIRDLRALIAYRYKLSQLRAFDFFPHTHHVELAVR
jgi:tRNA/tmRNA/rRNA uracil-C5-methylase (TrmA/RlmC/RlmD family)